MTAALRILSKVVHSDNRHSELQLWVNGDLVTEHAMVVRNSDFVYLMVRLQPEVIVVDRENISDDLWIRIKHIPEVELI